MRQRPSLASKRTNVLAKIRGSRIQPSQQRATCRRAASPPGAAPRPGIARSRRPPAATRRALPCAASRPATARRSRSRCPVSSSSVTNITPLAVPGRCRTVTMPQAARQPCRRKSAQRRCRQERLRQQCGRSSASGWRPSVRPSCAVIADDVVRLRRARQRGRFVLDGASAQHVLVRHRRDRLPQRLAPVRPASASALASASTCRSCAVELRAPRQIVRRCANGRTARAASMRARPRRRACRAEQRQPEAHRRPPSAPRRLQATTPSR